MLGMLLAYDEDGHVIATLDYLVRYDPVTGEPVGLVDFGAHEDAGGAMTDVWTVEGAKGSKVWPEWLGQRAHEFRVLLEGAPGNRRAEALIHLDSAHIRYRGEVEAAITERIREAGDDPADVRDLVGGPDRPLDLTREGKTLARRRPRPVDVAITESR